MPWLKIMIMTKDHDSMIIYVSFAAHIYDHWVGETCTYMLLNKLRAMFYSFTDPLQLTYMIIE